MTQLFVRKLENTGLQNSKFRRFKTKSLLKQQVIKETDPLKRTIIIHHPKLQRLKTIIRGKTFFSVKRLLS